ncbi:transcriptional regulator [Desulfitobacterium dichloroeliminans LMG P-21439]|uniref:Transcriptional regulator n=2 Tax=Desulfitobacterium dichloroeliminans TaxID=233055 RepID=L0F4E6_DESDL|nr:transcriptional regulator [Desulfitobacterium dichloroeliminans LMG P-21439]
MTGIMEVSILDVMNEKKLLVKKNIPIDYDSPVPLYAQLRDLLQEKIAEGTYKERIPSEREIMDLYSVSRSTVRKAITALVRDGVLEKVHGKGTFISLLPVEEWLGSLRSFNDVVKEMGLKPSIKLLYQGEEPAVGNATYLEVPEVYVVERLRLADNKPVAVEKQYYPLHIGQQIAKFDLNNVSIYDLLEGHMGVNLLEAEEIITGRTSTLEEAQLLGSAEPINVLQTERILFDSEGTPMEYEKSVYRSDMYSFAINLVRKRR